MPADICFHISSAEAAKNDHGDATALTLPITPALHIPSTAQPTASLRSLCFTNTLANATASDGTSSCTLGLFSGSGHPQFTNGSAAPDPWIGLVYTDAVQSTATNAAIAERILEALQVTVCVRMFVSACQMTWGARLVGGLGGTMSFELGAGCLGVSTLFPGSLDA